MLVRNLLFTLTIICLVSICSAQSEMNANSENLKIRKNVSRPEGKGWFIYGTAGYGIPFLSTNKFSF